MHQILLQARQNSYRNIQAVEEIIVISVEESIISGLKKVRDVLV